MKHRYYAVLIWTIVSVTGSAQDYNFSGNLGFLFNRAGDTVNVFEQRYGRMCYHNSNSVGQDNNEGYTLKTNLPTFTQSWSLSAKVTIPLAAEGLPIGSLPIESYAEISVGCLYGGNTFGIGLQVEPGGSPVTRLVMAETSSQHQEFFNGQGDTVNDRETVTLMIRYDSTKRLLTAYSDGKPIFDLDIAADGTNNSTRVLDWGMNLQSSFQIAFLATTSNYKVAKERPLQLDDFSFHIDGSPLTSPTLSISTQAVALGAVGNPAQRYEIQQSDNLEDWITTSTLYGTGGALQIPVAADTTNCFFRLR